jgi:Sec-independent protein translocase protein TatA
VLDITPFKVLIVLAVALIVLGPDRLPRLAHQAARAWRDIQRFRSHIASEVNETLVGGSSTRSSQSTRTMQATETTPNGAAHPDQPREAAPEAVGSSPEERERPNPGLN